MTSDAEYKNRQLIPRWNLSSTSAIIGDTLDLHQRGLDGSDSGLLLKKRDLWYREKSRWAGIDLVGTAIIAHATDDGAVANAVERLSATRFSCCEGAVLLAAKHYGEAVKSDGEMVPAAVRRLRRRLLWSPRDALCWMDLAYFYELNGDKKRAERSIKTAVSLAPDNRLVLRATARLYTHREDPDLALKYLRTSSHTAGDPWLLAAEISTAEAFGLRTPNAKRAARLVSEMDTHPLNVTELLGTLSTYEFNHGTSQKWGRRWLRKALATPNENTLAQAEHLVTRHRLSIDVGAKKAPLDYEARATRAHVAESFSDALGFARQWSDYQPLSSRPLLLGSYILSVIMRDHQEAIVLIERARGRVTYGDPMVANNLSFALANEGRTDEASRQLRRVSLVGLNADEIACITATRGLIAFRRGESEVGRSKYVEAIEHFRRNRDYDRLSRALMFFGNELVRANDKAGWNILKEAVAVANKHSVRDVQLSVTQALSGSRS